MGDAAGAIDTSDTPSSSSEFGHGSGTAPDSATIKHSHERKYPSVALSDSFNAAAHLAAAAAAQTAQPQLPAWLGFALVALAAAVGTLRFGFYPSIFAQANDDLARLAGFLGLPLVGLSFAQLSGSWPLSAARRPRRLLLHFRLPSRNYLPSFST